VKPLWKCPRCGHRFVTRNLAHSCGRYRLAEHFRGKDPAVRRLFRAWRGFVRRNGPMTVYAEKTRIVFQGRVRFAGAITRKRWLECGFWLQRFVASPRFQVEHIPPRNYVYRFRLFNVSQLDRELAELVREAYAIGQQEHLAARRRGAAGSA